MEVPAGQVNFRGSLPRSENVLQPMLHPEEPPLTIQNLDFLGLELLHVFGFV